MDIPINKAYYRFDNKDIAFIATYLNAGSYIHRIKETIIPITDQFCQKKISVDWEINKETLARINKLVDKHNEFRTGNGHISIKELKYIPLVNFRKSPFIDLEVKDARNNNVFTETRIQGMKKIYALLKFIILRESRDNTSFTHIERFEYLLKAMLLSWPDEISQRNTSALKKSKSVISGKEEVLDLLYDICVNELCGYIDDTETKKCINLMDSKYKENLLILIAKQPAVLNLLGVFKLKLDSAELLAFPIVFLRDYLKIRNYTRSLPTNKLASLICDLVDECNDFLDWLTNILLFAKPQAKRMIIATLDNLTCNFVLNIRLKSDVMLDVIENTNIAHHKLLMRLKKRKIREKIAEAKIAASLFNTKKRLWDWLYFIKEYIAHCILYLPLEFNVDMLGIADSYHIEVSAESAEIDIKSHHCVYKSKNNLEPYPTNQFFGVAKIARWFLHIYTTRKCYIIKTGEEIAPADLSFVVWFKPSWLSVWIYLIITLFEAIFLLLLGYPGLNFLTIIGFFGIAFNLALLYNVSPVERYFFRPWRKLVIAGGMLFSLFTILKLIRWQLLSKIININFGCLNINIFFFIFILLIAYFLVYKRLRNES